MKIFHTHNNGGLAVSTLIRFPRIIMACGIFAGSIAAASAGFPDKPIRFINPYAAGSATDLVVRAIAPRLSRELGQSVVVENKAGAGGLIGMEQVARSAPDGYTIGLGGISTNAIAPHLYPKMPFDARKDFSPVALLGASTGILAVRNDSPARSVEELVDLAKRHPGMTYGSPGVGTSPHLAGAMFDAMADLKMTHIGYRGGAPAITDLLGGHIDLMFNHLMPTLPLLKSGELRAIAVTNRVRSPLIPDVPTVSESAFHDFVVEPWFAVYGPAGMPENVVAALNAAFNAALADEEVKARLVESGFVPQSASAAGLGELTESEYRKYRSVVDDAQIRID